MQENQPATMPNGKPLPQGIVVGCIGGKKNTTVMIDTGDVYAENRNLSHESPAKAVFQVGDHISRRIFHQMPCLLAGRTGLRQAGERDTGREENQKEVCCGLHRGMVPGNQQDG